MAENNQAWLHKQTNGERQNMVKPWLTRWHPERPWHASERGEKQRAKVWAPHLVAAILFSETASKQNDGPAKV